MRRGCCVRKICFLGSAFLIFVPKFLNNFLELKMTSSSECMRMRATPL